MKTPVLILAFNRPTLLARVLESLKTVGAERIYVNIDGPRQGNDEDANAVMECQSLIAGIDWTDHVKVRFLAENKGCREAVRTGIDWFFTQVNQGIILEDDCIPDQSFYGYTTELLHKYANVPKVMHISGHNLAQAETEDYEFDYFFIRYPFVWGWATWQRAWQKMRVNFEGFKNTSAWSSKLPNRISVDYMYDKFQGTLVGRYDSWAYAWFYTLLLEDGYSIVPRVNLIANAGLGTDATHTLHEEWKDIPVQSLTFPLRHPTDIQISKTWNEDLFYLSQKSRRGLWIWKYLPEGIRSWGQKLLSK